MRLANKTALVTGAASGIRKAIATSFAAEGAAVAILDIDEKKSNQVVAAIQKLGRRACFVKCDVGSADQVKSAVADAVKFLGKLDILVNNAAIIRFSPVVDMAAAEWIAAGAVFLASDESRYMTGQHLTIDGGYVMDGSLPSAEYCKE